MPAYNTEVCKARLLREYREHGTLFVAFDFDNTIFDYHNTGRDFSDTIALLQKCSQLGFRLIMYTCDSEPFKLEWKRQYCTHFGISVWRTNSNPEKSFGEGAKVYYNILLDDRAGLTEASEILEYVINVIENDNTRPDKPESE